MKILYTDHVTNEAVLESVEQDYKSLCASVTICATMINIQTHTDRQHFDQLI